MLRSRILTGLVIALFAGVFASQVASCTLEQEGTVDVDTGPACQDVSTCDDGNPCTTETCPEDTLVCTSIKLNGAAPNDAQTAGDCTTIMCADGVRSDVDDANDYINDNNSCTDDACTNGIPTNLLRADGSACTQGTKMGTCNDGMCEVSCANEADCNDDNPCSTELCNTGTSKCVYTVLDGVLTPGVTPVIGDCKAQFCENGVNNQVFDDADVNDDQNTCTDDKCAMGMPTNLPIAARTPCTPGDVNVCDGNGACVACVVAADCVGITETECEKRSCVNNTCQIAYEGNTTPASPVLQTAGDCMKVVCNGAAGVTSIPDDVDVPVDNKTCTKDVCTNGVPSNPPEPQNLSCGGTQVCDGAGNCVGCTAASQCMGTDDFCKTRTCINNICGFSYTANGTDLPTGQTAGDCKVRECDGMGNVKTSPLTSDLPVDGNACTQDLCAGNGTPSNPPTTINSPCNVNGNDACDGSGNCKKSNSRVCGNNNECVSTFCTDGVCCNSNCPTVCMACNVTGNIGTCVAVPKGTDDGTCTGATQSCNAANDCDDENGQPCATASACLSNFCVDGVCCNTACDTACLSCAVTAGTCGNLPAGSTDNAPTNLCTGMSQCDGMGVCKRVNGAMCTNDNQCLNGNCVDGVCCDTMCNTDCKACNVAGSAGTCTNVPLNTDDGACTGTTMSCDGMGACKGDLGGACSTGGQCFSTFCVDGFCCNNACTGLCQSCKANDTGGTNGTCAPVTGGTDPGNECTAEMPMTCGLNGNCDGAGVCQKYSSTTECVPQSCSGSTQTNARNCNGTGTCANGDTTDCTPYNCGATACKTMCAGDGDCTSGNYCAAPACVSKKNNGQPCTGANQCNSNFCIDGVCCTTACLGTCQGCAAGTGTCGDLPLNTDDTNSTTTCTGMNTCNGSGMCKLKNGQTCTGDSQCASNNCPMGMPPRMCAAP